MNTNELTRAVSDFEAQHDVETDGSDALNSALQEAAAHIVELQARVRALDGVMARVAALEARIAALEATERARVTREDIAGSVGLYGGGE